MTSEGTLFRPDERERGFSTNVTLVPGGPALLLDKRVMVLARYEKRRIHRSNEVHLRIVASKGVPIVFERSLEKGIKHEGEIDYYREEVGAVVNRISRTTKNSIFIGNEYKVTVIEATRELVSAKIQSTQPLQTETVGISTQLLPLLREARS